MAGRDYNGLTGAECLELLLQQLREELSLDNRFSQAQAYHNVVLEVDFTLESYPREPAQEHFHKQVVVPKGQAVDPKKKKVVSQGRSKQVHEVPDQAREQLASPAVHKEQTIDGALIGTLPEAKSSF